MSRKKFKLTPSPFKINTVKPDYRQYDMVLLDNSLTHDIIRSDIRDHAAKVAKRQRNKQSVICFVTGLPIIEPFIVIDHQPLHCYRFITKGRLKNRIIHPDLLSAKLAFQQHSHPKDTFEFFKGLVFRAIDKHPNRRFFVVAFNQKNRIAIRAGLRRAEGDMLNIEISDDRLEINYWQLVQAVKNQNHPRREFFKTILACIPIETTVHYAELQEDMLNAIISHAMDNTLATTVAPHCNYLKSISVLDGFVRYYRQKWFVDKL